MTPNELAAQLAADPSVDRVRTTRSGRLLVTFTESFLTCAVEEVGDVTAYGVVSEPMGAFRPEPRTWAASERGTLADAIVNDVCGFVHKAALDYLTRLTVRELRQDPRVDRRIDTICKERPRFGFTGDEWDDVRFEWGPDGTLHWRLIVGGRGRFAGSAVVTGDDPRVSTRADFARVMVGDALALRERTTPRR